MHATRPFRSLLVANRGEIARRVVHTAARMGLRTIAVYSDADADALHVRDADVAVRIGAAPARESYLNIGALVDAARASAAEAVHPGYGFLAESAAFAGAVIDAGLVWVGPSPEAIRAMGDKSQARRLAAEAQAPVLPGYDGEDQSEETLVRMAREIGFPIMVKAAAGGGGRGMRIARSTAELGIAIATARSEALNAFGDDRLLLERALEGARHVEIQILSDTHGNCIHLGERDCSVQRRHQKLIEESPSPAVAPRTRSLMGEAAIALARSVGYTGAGTVECLLDADGRFTFMEMNTRLQVEHPVTEMITGIDLVEWQLRIAAGEALTFAQSDLAFEGHAIEARLCAEDPANDFLPQTGTVLQWRPHAGAVAFEAGRAPGTTALRLDSALASGVAITPHYDSMLAKVIARGRTRDEARLALATALDGTQLLGVTTNKDLLAAVLRDPEFAEKGATLDYLPRTAPHLVSRAIPAIRFAAAAALLAETHARGASFGEWTGWSNNPQRTMSLRVACNGNTRGVVLQRVGGTYLAEIGEDRFALSLSGEAAQGVTLACGGVRERLALARDGTRLHLAWPGATYCFEDVSHVSAPRRGGDANAMRLASPMNGRVVAIHAKVGEVAHAGEPLAVLEAMKMEHVLAAPATVRVAAVHVALGAQVAPGQLLVEFQPAATG